MSARTILDAAAASEESHTRYPELLRQAREIWGSKRWQWQKGMPEEQSVEGDGSRAGDGGAKVRQRKAGEREGEWRAGWRVTPFADPGKGAV